VVCLANSKSIQKRLSYTSRYGGPKHYQWPVGPPATRSGGNRAARSYALFSLPRLSGVHVDGRPTVAQKLHGDVTVFMPKINGGATCVSDLAATVQCARPRPCQDLTEG
jgi:hypothetical protein